VDRREYEHQLSRSKHPRKRPGAIAPGRFSV
jgi:hypothetical protein